MEIERLLSVMFSLTAVKAKVLNSDVMDAVKTVVEEETIKSAQISDNKEWCVVTLDNIKSRQKLIDFGLELKGVLIKPHDAETDITNVTVKDAPYEMDDKVIASALDCYGALINGSIRRQ